MVIYNYIATVSGAIKDIIFIVYYESKEIIFSKPKRMNGITHNCDIAVL